VSLDLWIVGDLLTHVQAVRYVAEGLLDDERK
jgi:hypothetical protein